MAFRTGTSGLGVFPDTAGAGCDVASQPTLIGRLGGTGPCAHEPPGGGMAGRGRTIVVGAAFVALVGAGLEAALADGSTTPSVYTACLGGGILYGVTTSTTPPTCKRGDVIVSWNSVGPQGPQGLQGLTGAAGPPGQQGPKGDTGATGPTGPGITVAGEPAGSSCANGGVSLSGIGVGYVCNGPQGARGANGNTILSGNGGPGTIGVDGDFYIDEVNHLLYGPKASGAWPGSGVSLIGPKGDTGAAGTNGNTILNGSGAPTSIGTNGDFYLDTSTSTLYGPKTDSGWGTGTSLIGASPAPVVTGHFTANPSPNQVSRSTLFTHNGFALTSECNNQSYFGHSGSRVIGGGGDWVYLDDTGSTDVLHYSSSTNDLQGPLHEGGAVTHSRWFAGVGSDTISADIWVDETESGTGTSTVVSCTFDYAITVY